MKNEHRSDELPLVSVIVPVFNGSKFLAEAIESVLRQTHQPVELIVVDDGSTDDSAQIANSFQEVRYLYQENQGVSVARNTGIAVTQGSFVAFLDADDRWDDNKLRLQVNYLLANPNTGYVLSYIRIHLEPETVLPRIFKEALLHEDHAGHLPSALMVRKTVLAQVGGFDPACFNNCEDIDWFARAKDSGFVAAILPETLVFRRMHGSNLTFQAPADYSSLLRTLKNSIDRKTSNASQTGGKQDTPPE